MRIKKSDLVVFSNIRNNKRNKRISFHMPGHKYGYGVPKYLKRNLLSIDTTELSYSDNLLKPESILKELLSKIEKVYKSEKSFISTNGSTMSILASFFAVFKEGDKVIISKDCHKSVLNAIKLTKIEPIFIDYYLDKERQIFMPPLYKNIIEKIDEIDNIKGIFFTYPNYYGVCQNAKEIISKAHSKSIPVIVDEAHGSHFVYSSKFPKSSLEYGADIVIQSIHKTLPALGQTGLLHVKNKKYIKKVEEYYNIFETSSPSYIMISMAEYAIEYMERNANVRIDKVSKWIGKLEECNFKKIRKIIVDDELRLIYNVYDTGLTGFEVAKILERKYNIYIEMSDLFNVVMIVTLQNKLSDFRKLKSALLYIDSFHGEERFDCERVYRAFEIKEGKSKRVSQKIVLPYPPGVPVLLQGDSISDDMQYYLELVKHNGGEILEC